MFEKESKIFMRPVKEELIDAKDYLKLTETEKRNIEKSEIIPPRLGEKGFGKIRLIYSLPVYKIKSC